MFDLINMQYLNNSLSPDRYVISPAFLGRGGIFSDFERVTKVDYRNTWCQQFFLAEVAFLYLGISRSNENKNFKNTLDVYIIGKVI